MSQRYILMPALSETALTIDNANVRDFLITLEASTGARPASLATRARIKRSPKISVKVVDTIQEDGAKLVEMPQDKIADFRFSYPGLRMIPEKFYHKAFVPPPKLGARVATTKRTTVCKVRVRDASGKPLEGIYTLAFTDYTSGAGDDGHTDDKGEVSLKLDKSTIERLYAYADHSFWSYCQMNVAKAARIEITLRPIDLNFTDSLRHVYPTANWPVIRRKIRVAVVDTGVGPHQYLPIAGGKNILTGADAKNYDDDDGHGTHVAGIIAANGGGLQGMAAGVELYVYKVFPKGGMASNFHIMKAIRQARRDGCDLINLSLVTKGSDEGIISEIKSAYREGILCFAANGNDQRLPVCFPAEHSLSIAVSAFGRKSQLPKNTVSLAAAASPYSTDRQDFVADFSNVGPETDLTAPGVGIISTFFNHRYAVMDGTSMACPAAVGMAARLLAEEGRIIKTARKQKRADDMLKFLATKIKSLGFGANFEGKGMLSP